MYTRDHDSRIVTVLVIAAAGLLGAALARQEPDRCECRIVDAATVDMLPEVEVVAKRLPANRSGQSP